MKLTFWKALYSGFALYRSVAGQTAIASILSNSSNPGNLVASDSIPSAADVPTWTKPAPGSPTPTPGDPRWEAPGYLLASTAPCYEELPPGTIMGGNGANYLQDNEAIILLHDFDTYCWKGESVGGVGIDVAHSIRVAGTHPWPNNGSRIVFFNGACGSRGDFSGFVSELADMTKPPYVQSRCYEPPGGATSVMLIPAGFDLKTAPGFRNDTVNAGNGTTTHRRSLRSAVSGQNFETSAGRKVKGG